MDLTIDEKLLRNTIDSSMDLIQVFKTVRDEHGEIIDFIWILTNKTAEKFYGDVVGKRLLTLNPDVIKEGIFDAFKKVVETGDTDESVRHYVYEQFDGWFLQSTVKQGDGVATTTKDITDIKKAEESLRESEKRFDSIANLVPDLLWASEPDGSTNWYNQRWLEYTGQRFEDALGWGWAEAIHLDDREGSAKWYAHAVETGKPLRQEHRIRRNDGEYRWFVVNATPVRDENGQVIKMYGAATDIHDSKQAEARLRESVLRAQQALSVPTVGVIFFDLEGLIYDANDAFCSMSGYTKADFTKGKVRWDDVTRPEFMQATLMSQEELRSSGKNTPYQKQYIRPDGSSWWGLFAGKRLSQNECVEFVLDITGQKQNEQRKNGFISMVSHELKTPLTSSIGYLQASHRKVAMNGDQGTARMLERASKQLWKMTTLINGFLNVARLEAGQIHIDKTRYDLALIVKEVGESLVPETRSHHIVFAPVEETWVYIDKDKIEQVFNNLISNATKYSPAHTTIQITCLKKGASVQVTVRDEGIGIGAEDQARLFDRFYRVEGQETKSIAGFGIGLYICKEVIERHGGKIGVRSTEGEGSTFWFELPILE
jgi:two-component system sensor histidine kinase VicK